MHKTWFCHNGYTQSGNNQFRIFRKVGISSRLDFRDPRFWSKFSETNCLGPVHKFDYTNTTYMRLFRPQNTEFRENFNEKFLSWKIMLRLGYHAKLTLGKGSNKQNGNLRWYLPWREGGLEGVSSAIYLFWKMIFVKNHLESFPDCENVFCT